MPNERVECVMVVLQGSKLRSVHVFFPCGGVDTLSRRQGPGAFRHGAGAALITP